MMFPKAGYSQENMAVEEITLQLDVPRVGSLEIPALIHNQEAYLLAKDLFDFLKIKNTVTADFNTLEGIFIDPKSVYRIDWENQYILYQDKTFKLNQNDLILKDNDLYLKSRYFGQVFDLNCLFNFRNLSITVTTKLELPAIREKKLEQMRKNMNALKGEKIADTIIAQDFSLFSPGVADWTLATTQTNGQRSSVRASVNMGAMVAGGDTKLNLNYDSGQPFNPRNQYYNWRYVNNENTLFRQITAGRINMQSISSIYAPINGIQITNTPTTYRRSFGSYRISDTTEPGWTIELYVNNTLIDFVIADASGFYTFDIPLVYGSTAIKLRFYGPWGEERIQEQDINIPFNFLPAKKTEYQLSVGAVDDNELSLFYRANLNYGLNNRITIGGGAEYLFLDEESQPIPFLNTSVRLSSKLLVSAEYAYGVRAKGLLNFKLPGSIQLDLDYTKYEKEQTAITFSYLEDRRISISVPIHAGGISAFSRFSYQQYALQNSKNTNVQFLLSGVVAKVSTNLTTYLLITDPANPYLYSNLSLIFRLRKGIRFTPRVQYEYRKKQLSTMRAEIEKRVGTFCFANLAYERNMLNKTSSINLSLRLNFSALQVSFSATRENNSTSASQSLRGSLLYNDQTKQLSMSKESNIGRGGLIVMPFLDLNGNGHKETNEPKAAGLKLKISGGRVVHNAKDTTISVTNLEGFTKYMIELNENSFDNFAWQLKHKNISVTAEPNHFKKIAIPVTVAGEISGTVYNIGKEGMGRIIVNFYNNKSVFVGKTITESDGYFSFVGLSPGNYTVRIDPDQLKKINLKSSSILTFKIKPSIEGDFVEGLDFILEKQ